MDLHSIAAEVSLCVITVTSVMYLFEARQREVLRSRDRDTTYKMRDRLEEFEEHRLIQDEKVLALGRDIRVGVDWNSSRVAKCESKLEELRALLREGDDQNEDNT